MADFLKISLRGTVTEGLFNVVISSPGKIDIVRFGAGEDDTFNY